MMTPSEAFKANPIMLISNLLVIVGALNWLAIGLLRTDYVTQFVGINAKYVFIIVGLAGVYLAYHKIMWFMHMDKDSTETTVIVEHMAPVKSASSAPSDCRYINGKLVCTFKKKKV